MTRRWDVGTKLVVGFGLTLAIFLVVGLVSYRSTAELIDASESRKHTYDVLDAIQTTLSLLQDVEIGQRSYVLVGDESYRQQFVSAADRIDASLQTLRQLTRDTPRQQSRLDVLVPLVNARIAFARETIAVRQTRGMDEATRMVTSEKGKEFMTDIRRTLGEMRSEEETLLTQRVTAAENTAARTRWTILLGTLVGLALALLAAALLTRSIATPLKEITTIAERITVGDVGVQVAATDRADEVGALTRAFGRMTASLRTMAMAAEQIADGDLRSTIAPQSPQDVLGSAFARMTGNLREQTRHLVEGANVLGAAASEIVASTTQLASSASESAAAVTETTTTVEEVRQTAQVASQKAQHVSESAQKVAQVSQAGRKATDEATGGMTRIRQQMEAIAAGMGRLSEQSHTIGQIIATVEDLAAQSNLLAVNAAIEAAKAGEHGKGFSVVAQEVKSLAEQSRHATTQVRTILGDIQKATATAVLATEQGSKAVEAGIAQTEAAGDAIRALGGSVTEASQAAIQIAASSQQQLIGVDQVAGAMENIRQASAQNVASAKQLESAARNLSELGQRLKQIVDRYKI